MAYPRPLQSHKQQIPTVLRLRMPIRYRVHPEVPGGSGETRYSPQGFLRGSISSAHPRGGLRYPSQGGKHFSESSIFNSLPLHPDCPASGALNRGATWIVLFYSISMQCRGAVGNSKEKQCGTEPTNKPHVA